MIKTSHPESSVVATAAFFMISMVAFLGACSPTSMNKSSLGKNRQASSSTIVNGVEVAADDSFAKTTVAIAESQGSTHQQFCSGTLIAKNIVLTAGHCGEFLEGREGSILFGLSEHMAVAVKIERVIIHSEYNNNSNYVHKGENIGQNWSDLALVKMVADAPAGYEPAEMLIDDSLLADQVVVTLVGYGLTSGGENGTGAGLLRKTNVKIDAAKFSDQEFATDEAATGSCNGDSGGPVYLTTANKIYVVGATSRGDRYCKSYGVYSAVSRFQPWITETMALLNTMTQEPTRLSHEDRILTQVSDALLSLGVGQENKALLPLQ